MNIDMVWADDRGGGAGRLGCSTALLALIERRGDLLAPVATAK